MEIFGFCGGVVHDSVFLEYDVASVGKQFPTFRRTVFKNQTPRPPKYDDGMAFLRNTRNQ